MPTTATLDLRDTDPALSDDEILEAVAAEVRAAMARRRVTGEALAAMIGTTGATLSRRLSGRYPFTIIELMKIAQVLRVPVLDLLPESVRSRWFSHLTSVEWVPDSPEQLPLHFGAPPELATV